jgi:hypothetical protein
MKRYKVVKPIVLGFLSGREQVDSLIVPADGIVLESDGKTIWALEGEKRIESITMGNAIDLWLEQSKIEGLT